LPGNDARDSPHWIVVDMGQGKVESFLRCPHALLAAHPKIDTWRRAYSMLVRFPTLPQPGLNDPQLHAALVAIQRELDDLDEADMKRAGSK
jgi:hypothetical protein